MAKFKSDVFRERWTRAAKSHEAQVTVDEFPELAAWCLSAAWRDKVDVPRPALPADPGSCAVLLARRAAGAPGELLADAFPVPLHWSRGRGHSPRLPDKLRELAADVVGDLAHVPEVAREPNWSLAFHPASTLADYDLSDGGGVFVGWESGWAALAGGLYLAATGLRADPTVFSSAARGAFHDTADIARAAEKLAAVRAWGGKQFYVRTSEKIVYGPVEGVEVVELNYSASGRPGANRADALTDYFAALGAQPPVNAPFAERARYFAHTSGGRKDDYYLRYVLEENAREHYLAIRARMPDFQPTHVVSVLSKEITGVALGLRATRAKHAVLLVHRTIDNREKLVARFRDAFGSYFPGANSLRLELIGADEPDRQTLRNLEREQVRAILKDLPADSLAIDLTPGFKMTSLILQAVAPPDTWLMYCRQQWGETNRPLPGSEWYDVWRKREDAAA